MGKKAYSQSKNNFNSKRDLPRGVAVYQKKRKDGTFITTKKNRYDMARGEKRIKIFEELDAKAKNIDKYLKEYVTHQVSLNKGR